MRNLKFFPVIGKHQINISRICAEDNLPAFWYFKFVNETYGTAASIAAAQVAAEKALKWEFSKLHGEEPSPSFTPESYAAAAGFKDVKSWAKAYKAERKIWISQKAIYTGWTLIA